MLESCPVLPTLRQRALDADPAAAAAAVEASIAS